MGERLRAVDERGAATLAVRVWLNGVLVEDRLLPVRRRLALGEEPRALVAFPGAAVEVRRVGSAVLVDGRELAPGARLTLLLGAVVVELEHGQPAPRLAAGGRAGEGSLDLRFLGVVALVTALLTWGEALRAELGGSELMGVSAGPPSPGIQDEARGTILVAPTGSALARALDAGDEGARGPRHLPDARAGGTDWHGWYRGAVPEDERLPEALERLRVDPQDPEAHRVVARAAYDRDEYEVAAWHYRWLLDWDPRDRGLRVDLARAEKRRGRHAREIELYRQALVLDPHDGGALAGLAVALARVGRLDEADGLVAELQAASPGAPTTEMTVALVAALDGRDLLALEALDRALAGRGQLSSELQLELRRDLALDPAFADLRRDLRLRALLHRHLGAAAPPPAG